jgi:hypothetical protein
MAGEYLEQWQPWGADQLMVLAALRHSLGGSKRFVGPCADWIVQMWPHFSGKTRRAIEKTLEDAFCWDERYQSYGGPSVQRIGDDAERAQWEKVRALWAEAGKAGE